MVDFAKGRVCYQQGYPIYFVCTLCLLELGLVTMVAYTEIQQ